MTTDRPATPLDRATTPVADVAPWYLNGTLSPEDRAWFESALADDAQAQEALAFDREIATELARRAQDVPADIGWDALLERVREDGAAESGATGTGTSAPAVPTPASIRQSGRRDDPVTAGGLRAWLSGLLSPGVVAAMASVLVAQTVAIGFLLNRPAEEAEYRSVASPRPVPVIRAIIVESTSERQLREALLAQGLTIAAGPDSLGQYLLVASDDADLPSAATRLREAGVFASFSLDSQVMDR